LYSDYLRIAKISTTLTGSTSAITAVLTISPILTRNDRSKSLKPFALDPNLWIVVMILPKMKLRAEVLHGSGRGGGEDKWILIQKCFSTRGDALIERENAPKSRREKRVADIDVPHSAPDGTAGRVS
jgi:hypothetical protein